MMRNKLCARIKKAVYMCAYAPRPRKKRYVMCNVAVAVCANALESVRVSVEWREKKGREAMIHRECLS